MSTYVDRLLESLPESERHSLDRFLKDSKPLSSLDEPLPDLREPSTLCFQGQRKY